MDKSFLIFDHKKWKSFRTYLQKVGQRKESVTQAEFFDHYLPFSAVFGFGEAWVKNCQKMGLLNLPEWLHSEASGGGFNALYTVMHTFDTSSSSSADGGGASGGGSSGAG